MKKSFELVLKTKELGRLPIVTFVAGGIATQMQL